MAIAVREDRSTSRLDFASLLKWLDLSLTDELWLDYDREADCLYIYFQEQVDSQDADEIAPGVIAFHDNDDVHKIVAYTILNASKQPLDNDLPRVAYVPKD